MATNTRIQTLSTLITPSLIKEQYPITDAIKSLVNETRETIGSILESDSHPKKVFIIGPCSIHDENSAIDYATRLSRLKEHYEDQCVMIMRVYFEKPRTTVGWKGFINDPDLNGTYNAQEGIKRARKLLIQINALGVPVACEFLDTISPQYFSDLISWGAIGARTTESQVHRELASGLSMPIGFKNNTAGNVTVAIDAVQASTQKHTFFAVDENGQSSIAQTTGNPWCHIILRGGPEPNYDSESILKAKNEMLHRKMKPKILIDCSHGNSKKKHKNQEIVLKDVYKNNYDDVFGFMIESHIREGNQKLTNKSELEYGVSITDECISWDKTEELFAYLFQ